MSVPTVDTNRGIATKTQQAKSLEYKSIDDRKYIPKQYQEVAEAMETQFAETMVKQMNQTVDETPGEDSGMDYYKSLQTTERAKMMAKQNNLGLQNVILDQIYPKRMRNDMALKQYEAQANLIHHNLPSYKLEKKTDIIEMGKNDSTSVSGNKTIAGQNSEGGLP
ncbi:MAG: rod-binding protein [Bacteriovorax sp.]|nr:rod-binding protein [Bacteriovorax sp.]